MEYFHQTKSLREGSQKLEQSFSTVSIAPIPTGHHCDDSNWNNPLDLYNVSSGGHRMKMNNSMYSNYSKCVDGIESDVLLGCTTVSEKDTSGEEDNVNLEEKKPHPSPGVKIGFYSNDGQCPSVSVNTPLQSCTRYIDSPSQCASDASYHHDEMKNGEVIKQNKPISPSHSRIIHNPYDIRTSSLSADTPLRNQAQFLKLNHFFGESDFLINKTNRDESYTNEMKIPEERVEQREQKRPSCINYPSHDAKELTKDCAQQQQQLSKTGISPRMTGRRKGVGKAKANVSSPYTTTQPVSSRLVGTKESGHVTRYLPPPPPRYDTFDVLCGDATMPELANEHVIWTANVWIAHICNSHFYREHGIWTNTNPAAFISGFDNDPCPKDLGAFLTIREWCIAAEGWWERHFNYSHKRNRRWRNDSRQLF